MNKQSNLLLFAVLACASTTRVAHAADILVPNTYGDVDAAMAFATTGDRVVITSTSGNPYASFTVNKSVEVTKGSGVGEVLISGSGSSYAATITASGGKITGLTLRGGNSGVVSVGPGTVQNCRIEDETGTLQSAFAVTMASTSGKLLDSRVVRVASAQAVHVTAAAEVKRCFIDVQGTYANDQPAIRVDYSGVTIESDTLNFEYGQMTHSRRGIEVLSGGASCTIHSN